MSDRFAHELRIDAIRDGERLDLDADAAEREAIARRLGLEGLDRLEAHAALSCSEGCIRAEGRLQASLVQSCVVTGDPIATHVDEPFDILFIPAPTDHLPDEEIELGAADCDVVFHDGARIDLGGAIADTLALGIDPYPRSAAAEAAIREAGVISEADAGPFAVLAQLKRGGGDET